MQLVNLFGWGEIAVRLCCAVLIGSLVGLNRELGGKPAGLRTNALVCLGAALLVLAGLAVGIDSTGRVDPASGSRAIQGIITGIGFLGAGVIIREAAEVKVHGLTTAATIWISAALGILCGAGVWVVAAAGLVLTLLVLVIGRPFERFLHRKFPGLTEKDHGPSR